jgi:hypothetical protein
VRAHDPFELIRWLALSQPDPRKALAELVQNSLDANARTIRVTRIREKKLPCLRILDDGEGVIPEMDRPEALRYIATHIGHSRKRSLSPEERLRLMTQGQYGIGLLGFWSLGDRLEMRTSVPGQRAHRLVLHRDRPDFVIEPLRGRLPLDELWTEIVVVGLHREAVSVMLGRRAADYLAAELRGQLLSRDVELLVEDRMSRGRAQKLIQVRPPRFLGEQLEGIGPLEVPGHRQARFEIYLAGEPDDDGDQRGIAVYAAGTLVARSFDELGSLALDHPPWTDSRLTGLVDFPDFHVAPGSRRGIIVDEAAGAFADALRTVEPVLESVLERLERRRAKELDRSLVRDLQRAYRDFYRQRPRYAMLPVESERDRGAGPSGAGAASDQGRDFDAGRPSPDEAAPVDETDESPLTEMDVDAHDAESIVDRTPPVETLELLPPGPLAEVRIRPQMIRLVCNGRRLVRATGLDATGRTIEESMELRWYLPPHLGSLADDGSDAGSVILHAASEPGHGRLSVDARAGDHAARADADVEILDELAARHAREGIPEPELIDQPGAAWRSRMQEGRWQVNTGHREYQAIAERPALKLRYLALLFAKEVVLRSHQDPRLEKPLEQIVEVFAFADRNLGGKRGARRRGGDRSAASVSVQEVPGDDAGDDAAH